MRYKGMLWIDGEPNRLLFQGVQRLYSADWDRPWGDETPHSTLVFIGISCRKRRFARRLRVAQIAPSRCALPRRFSGMPKKAKRV
jgi:G3E family GTPase